MEKPLLIGAVLYDPKVSIIWEIIADFFNENNFPVDVVFYTNYEIMVEALIGGHIDMAWNSPLAWLYSQHLSGNTCKAIAMRDTDQDRISYIVVRKDDSINKLSDLNGEAIALGANDSPQATLIPLQYLIKHGLQPGKDFTYKKFNLLEGKHGDHIGGELEAFKSLEKGEVKASAMLDLNWQTWTNDGTISPDKYMILSKTEVFDHCVFTIGKDFNAEVEKQFLDVLFSMSYENPEHRKMMDMEGLKAWKEGRTTGFNPLKEAVKVLNYFK